MDPLSLLSGDSGSEEEESCAKPLDFASLAKAGYASGRGQLEAQGYEDARAKAEKDTKDEEDEKDDADAADADGADAADGADGAAAEAGMDSEPVEPPPPEPEPKKAPKRIRISCDESESDGEPQPKFKKVGRAAGTLVPDAPAAEAQMVQVVREAEERVEVEVRNGAKVQWGFDELEANLTERLGTGMLAIRGPARPGVKVHGEDQAKAAKVAALVEPLRAFARPTPIQSFVWSLLLGGRDVIGIAPTGSGKTLAYLLPALALGTTATTFVALVLVPTRELAKQIQQAP